MKNVSAKSIRKLRVALLVAPLSALLLACATNGTGEGGRVEYRYPPDSLLVVGANADKPSLEQLTGPDGDGFTGRYINDLEFVALTRGQQLRCINEWKERQKALDEGRTPDSDPPPYCVFPKEE